MFNVGASSGFSRLADLFFTRRIGLSDTGQPVPIIGGTRVSGKVERHNIAAMNITTQEAFGNPGDNFFVGPLQPRHPRAVEGRGHRHRQELPQRRALQPDAGRRHHPRRAPQLHDQRIPGQDRHRALRRERRDPEPLPRRGGPGHGGIRPGHVAQPRRGASTASTSTCRRTSTPRSASCPAPASARRSSTANGTPVRGAGASACSTRCGTSPTPPIRTTGC